MCAVPQLYRAGRSSFSCNKQVVGGQISLPAEAEFRSTNFNLSVTDPIILPTPIVELLQNCTLGWWVS